MMYRRRDDRFRLSRFIDAQEEMYETVVKELKRGQKVSHWMWYIFPQIIGLGTSDTNIRYSITCVEEAREYNKHPILGKRLKECCEILLNLPKKDPIYVFGHDTQKLRSCVTLFYLATGEQVYWEVLREYFDYEYDTKTLDILADQDESVITKVELETEHIFSLDPNAYIDQMVITEKEVRYVKKDFSNDKVMEEWKSIVNQKDYQRLCKQSKRLFWCSMNNVNKIDYEHICFDAGVFKITITLADGNKYC